MRISDTVATAAPAVADTPRDPIPAETADLPVGPSPEEQAPRQRIREVLTRTIGSFSFRSHLQRHY